MNSLPPYLLFIAATAISAIISWYSVKKVIFITGSRKLYDIPDNIRKIHGGEIPSLGGIGIFTGYIVTAAFFLYMNMKGWNYMLVSSVILFFTGIYDDIINMSPTKKLLAQVIASAVTVYFADIRLVSFCGVFGIGELPYWVSILFTTFCATFFINAFNFIDGIDGLACTLAMLYLGIIGILFGVNDNIGIGCIAFSLAGATAGLLYYNVAPAKIYMGDTGSMVLGFTIFMLAILFLKIYGENAAPGTFIIHSRQGAFLFTLAILFLPMYDAIRVFIIRLSKGHSPFRADRAHLHYYLLDAGFSHSRAVAVIAGTNILILLVAYLSQGISPYVALLAMLGLTSLLVFIVYRLRMQNMAGK